jgi:membrane protease YdiL (CAAX protease family)
VGLFYAIAFGMVCLLGLAFSFLGANMTSGGMSAVFQLAVAFLYMPMPLVAGLVVERVARRRPLIHSTWSDFKAGWLKVIVVSALSALAMYASNLALTVLLGNVLGLAGVGQLVATQQQVFENLTALFGASRVPASATSGMPPVALLYALGAWAGIMAGFTINGLFAFGEEYGWRGVLMDELRPLGDVRANVLTGIMWGLWHAPMILLGFNYGSYRWAGIGMMCVWLIPFSFLLWRSRDYSGSVIAPAVIHGAFNGTAGFYLLLVATRNPLVSAPVGLVGALSVGIAAAAVWIATAKGVRARRDADAAARFAQAA